MASTGKPVYGPEIAVEQTELSFGLFQEKSVTGYLLSNGIVLLENERDEKGFYKGGARMDGMYLQNGRRYAPVFSDTGSIRAFKELMPENYLANAEAGMEQNYNQIDGIINNVAPEKAESPSIRETLRQFKKEQNRSQDAPRQRESQR